MRPGAVITTGQMEISRRAALFLCTAARRLPYVSSSLKVTSDPPAGVAPCKTANEECPAACVEVAFFILFVDVIAFGGKSYECFLASVCKICLHPFAQSSKRSGLRFCHRAHASDSSVRRV